MQKTDESRQKTDERRQRTDEKITVVERKDTDNTNKQGSQGDQNIKEPIKASSPTKLTPEQKGEAIEYLNQRYDDLVDLSNDLNEKNLAIDISNPSNSSPVIYRLQEYNINDRRFAIDKEFTDFYNLIMSSNRGLYSDDEEINPLLNKIDKLTEEVTSKLYEIIKKGFSTFKQDISGTIQTISGELTNIRRVLYDAFISYYKDEDISGLFPSYELLPSSKPDSIPNDKNNEKTRLIYDQLAAFNSNPTYNDIRQQIIRDTAANTNNINVALNNIVPKIKRYKQLSLFNINFKKNFLEKLISKDNTEDLFTSLRRQVESLPKIINRIITRIDSIYNGKNETSKDSKIPYEFNKELLKEVESYKFKSVVVPPN